MAATTISRANIGTNDDGSGTAGTVITVAYINLIYDNIDALFTGSGGVTYNQGSTASAILQLESSDVAHGITSFAGTQVFGFFIKCVSNTGGLNMVGLTEDTKAARVTGYATTEDTTKSTAAAAHIELVAATKSGTSVTNPGANANMVVITSNGTTRFIFDSDGDSHQDVGTAWTNFDLHDDVALLTALSGAVSRRDDPLRHGFSSWLTEHRDVLERERIVTINDGEGEDGSVFINWSRTHMLTIGAIRQLGERLARMEQRLLEA